eukprot:CAMPEP_0119306180 /NCGR_PEP_ID=MMETSP1333-20130426/6989_1 /TAXON_ID=418940 /ORGANISM="Scyphosphaera apsteinii, Strain RCC1455" /LENGTH=123 /DNA_ID=CAMNT_0007309421 /DNA_START=1746 /DNA_END=2118 /DNA_ORIENTATION=+
MMGKSWKQPRELAQKLLCASRKTSLLLSMQAKSSKVIATKDVATRKHVRGNIGNETHRTLTRQVAASAGLYTGARQMGQQRCCDMSVAAERGDVVSISQIDRQIDMGVRRGRQDGDVTYDDSR